MSYRIVHENTEIKFTIERRSRRSTTIQVHRDQSVKVLAPKFSADQMILKQVEQRASWILKKQKQFAGLPVNQSQHEFIDGELFKYLGEDHILKLSEGKAGVVFDGNAISMTAPESYGPEQKKKLLQKWYRRQSEIIFAERMTECMKTAAAIGIKSAPEWKPRVLRRSWGSCSPGGKLNLNLELVSAPVRCIDYVILHEICHLKEHNHSPRFYKHMERLCPDWKLRRRELNDGYTSILI